MDNPYYKPLTLRMRKTTFTIVLLILFQSCEQKGNFESTTLFTNLSPEDSGIRFSNDIVENDTLNYFTFPYLYMGGGVAIGDINNDGLADIYFTGNMVSNKLYLNKGSGKFEDITASAGMAGDNRWYTGVTMADVNNDGWLDIYACVAGKYATTKNQLFINNRDNTFTESADSFGLADNSPSVQATFFDYDNDGFLDVYVGNYPVVPVSMGNTYYHNKMLNNDYYESAHLYKNNGDNSFTDVTKEAGVWKFGLTLGVVAADFNNDGWRDLYVSNDFNVPDYLYLNNGNGTFSEKIKGATSHISMFGMGCDAADFNNDGLIDILQVDMTPEDHKRSKTNMASMSPASFYQAVELDMHYQYMQNSLQVNNGVVEGGLPVFSDVSRIAGVATTDWSWGALFIDVDNDGMKDMLITNGMKRDVNNNDINEQYESSSFFGNNTTYDYSLLPSQPIDNYAFKNDGDYTFSNTTKAWGLSGKGFSNGLAYGDLDNDGDLDVVINNLDSYASFFRNESNKTGNHYLRVKLTGPETNPFGLDSRVTVSTKTVGVQVQELTLTRGFQSSVEPVMHFGLGKHTEVAKVTIAWPDGRQQTLDKVAGDQLLVLDYANAEQPSGQGLAQSAGFKDITVMAGIDFVHEEDKYNDFAYEPLLPHKNSAMGPGLAVGDVNGDGLEDFFIGNAAGSPGALYLQNAEGLFVEMDGPWTGDKEYEDVGALLFDADNDGDLDLYVVNGGNDPSKQMDFYQDRLYMNTPIGFVKTPLPAMPTSGHCVVAGDYDNDGDLDLFVGGRVVPGRYPVTPQSYILRNDGGKDKNIAFTDVTEAIAPALARAGMVTSAIWEDFDGDNDPDLIIAGEWMPIEIFENRDGQFKKLSGVQGLENSEGWWYGLAAADLDNDGDMDFIAGNLGLNYKYKASIELPFEIYANDFDENNHLDIVLGFNKHGTKYPVRGRECSSQQVPAIKERFKTYAAFADASLSEIYGKHMLENSLHFKAYTFASCWIENNGDQKFTMHRLPNQSQISSVNDIEVIDFNGDPYPDILMAGNLYNAEVETPRNDAGVGLVLLGSADGQYRPLPYSESGLMLKGEVKNIAPIMLAGGNRQGFLVAYNDAPLQLILLRKRKISP